MIGRGALSNPFLPGMIKSDRDGVGRKTEKFKAFYEELFARYQERLCGPGHLLNHMKGFWTYFAGAFEDGQDFAKRVHRTFKLPHYLETVQCFFRQDAEWRGNDRGFHA